MAAPSRGRRLNVLLYAGQALVVIFFAFPLLWVVSMSLKSAAGLLATPPAFIPTDPQWGNYVHVLATTSIPRYMLNSFVVVAGAVAGALLVSVPAAYSLSRFRFRGKRSYSRAVLAAQLISPVILVVPLYRVFVALHLINTYVGLIIVYVAIVAPFLTWFLKDYFDTVPLQLDEAAMVDGCSRLRAMVTVVLPGATSGIVSAALIVAVLSWSQFVVPFVLLDEQALYPVSVGVINLQATSGSGQITLQYLAAGSVIAVAPVVIIFAVLQRYIIGGLTSGSVKG